MQEPIKSVSEPSSPSANQVMGAAGNGGVHLQYSRCYLGGIFHTACIDGMPRFAVFVPTFAYNLPEWVVALIWVRWGYFRMDLVRTTNAYCPVSKA